MSDPRDSRPDDPARVLDAVIDRNAEVVRRGRKERGFLKRLGLSLPVTPADVKQAYRDKARQTHPDRNGDPAEFRKVQEAFEEALAYAERNGKRLPWLGTQLPIYLAQREIISMVEQWGGSVEVERLDWLEDTVGEDFSLIADRLRKIDLSGLQIGDPELDKLLGDSDGIRFLEMLDLSQTAVTDESVIHVIRASSLRRLDVRGTHVSASLVKQLGRLPQIESVEGARGMFGRWLR